MALAEEQREKCRLYRKDAQAHRIREEDRLSRLYQVKTREDCFDVEQENTITQDRKTLYLRELKAQYEARLQMEKSRLESEHEDKVRMVKAHSHLEDAKALVKARLALKYQQEENALSLDHYRGIRDLQMEKSEKYKLVLEQSTRQAKEEWEAHYQRLSEQLLK